VIRIRQASKDDAASIAQLHAKSWRLAYDGILSDDYLSQELDTDRLNDWTRRLSAPEKNQYVIVAESTDVPSGLVGFACAYGAFDEQVGTLLENLHAHPEHKKAGIGKLLLRQIALWNAQHYPDKFLHLWVLRKNKPAIGFYQHMGAVEDAEAIWDAPGGTLVPELRFTWYEPGKLI